jgi:hypothetical protein
VLANLTFLL